MTYRCQTCGKLDKNSYLNHARTKYECTACRDIDEKCFKRSHKPIKLDDL